MTAWPEEASSSRACPSDSASTSRSTTSTCPWPAASSSRCALDAKLRRSLKVELKALQERAGITFLYVTHDQEEALTMSARLAVLDAGRIAQVGTPRQVYEEPADSYVADFLGAANLMEVLVSERTGDSAAVLKLGDTALSALHGCPASPGEKAHAVIRPERVRVEEHGSSGVNRVPALVERVVFPRRRHPDHAPPRHRRLAPGPAAERRRLRPPRRRSRAPRPALPRASALPHAASAVTSASAAHVTHSPHGQIGHIWRENGHRVCDVELLLAGTGSGRNSPRAGEVGGGHDYCGTHRKRAYREHRGQAGG
jgi:hypothetical protein